MIVYYQQWDRFIFANQHDKPTSIIKNPKFTLKDLHVLVHEYVQVDPMMRSILEQLVRVGEITEKDAQSELKYSAKRVKVDIFFTLLKSQEFLESTRKVSHPILSQFLLKFVSGRGTEINAQLLTVVCILKHCLDTHLTIEEIRQGINAYTLMCRDLQSKFLSLKHNMI